MNKSSRDIVESLWIGISIVNDKKKKKDEDSFSDLPWSEGPRKVTICVSRKIRRKAVNDSHKNGVAKSRNLQQSNIL